MSSCSWSQEAVLKGNFASNYSAWKVPSRKISVVVSFTFTNTHLERNILQEKVSRVVQAAGRRHGVEVTFGDMRYGVRDENTLLIKVRATAKHSQRLHLMKKETAWCLLRMTSRSVCGITPPERCYGSAY